MENEELWDQINTEESETLQADVFETIERIVQRRIIKVQLALRNEKMKLLKNHAYYVGMAMAYSPEWSNKDAEEYVNESTEMMVEDRRESIYETIGTIMAWGEYMKLAFLNWQEGREPNSARIQR